MSLSGNAPFFSIITVCFNEPHLERTCESIIEQSFQDFQWVVIDAGSNAETLKKFEPYKHRIDTFISEPDEGIYDGMNKGIAKSNGTWLNFMNAGDYFATPNILEYINENINSNPLHDIFYGNHFANDSSIKIDGPCFTKKDLYFKTICQQSAFIKNTVLNKFNFDTEYKICADWDLWYKLQINACNAFYMNNEIAHFYENGISHTSPEKLFKELSEIRKKYFTKDEIIELKKYQMELLRKRNKHV